MKTGFYSKIARSGLQKNRRLYLPYILSGSFMVMMSYIVFFLSSSEMLVHIKGGSVLSELLPVGSVMIAMFSVLFLFYSNSFLLRQRNREFGLYNVLGMDKRNLGKIMSCEVLFSGCIAIGSGLILGITFSKFAELIMHNLLQEDIDYTLRIDFLSAGKTAFLFAGIYFLLLLNSLWKIHRLSPLELLHSNQTGEKSPKANWFWAVSGAIILAGAYGIVLSIEEPRSAANWFMVAVVMVIIATYLLFMSGSVALCKLLQKNKRYYYKANHFVSVSSMSYRMKRNGAGLASICILVTMVIVMLSSTLSLYTSEEDIIAEQYPRDIAIQLSFTTRKNFKEDTFSNMSNKINEIIPEKENVVEFSGFYIPGRFTKEGMIIDHAAHSELSQNASEYLHIISLADYNRIMGKDEELSDNECLLYSFRTEYNCNTFTIENCETLKVKKILDEMYIPTFIFKKNVSTNILVVSDPFKLVKPIEKMKRDNDDYQTYLKRYWTCNFDMNASEEEISAACNLIDSNIFSIISHEKHENCEYYFNYKTGERSWFYDTYAGLLFISILLSIVFLFAAVLIIYYKQISEGYEDRNRFEIMQKVGMTKQDIRRSINSQVLTVFFAPLLLAGVHLAFAFPIIRKLLLLFGFSNVSLMIFVSVASFSVFALVYALVYKITSHTYHTIVSGHKDGR